MEANKLTDEDIMPYGKYKGEKLGNVPDEYFLYMYENGKLFTAIEEYVEENLDAIKANIKRNQLKKENQV